MLVVLQILRERQYTDITMQIGRGDFKPINTMQDIDVTVDYFRYKDSIAEDISCADLVISHAGISTTFAGMSRRTICFLQVD